MHPNEALIRRFYEAFNAHDAGLMGACYAEHARFRDPVFPQLNGVEVRDMWAMLCESKDLKVEVSDIVANDRTGSAKWEAWYTFPPTKEKVHNIILAEFHFEDGRIVDHQDSFSFARWSKQALGPMGWLVGRVAPGWLQKQVQTRAQRSLDIWRSKRQGSSF